MYKQCAYPTIGSVVGLSKEGDGRVKSITPENMFRRN